jgi:hypothetical protein
MATMNRRGFLGRTANAAHDKARRQDAAALRQRGNVGLVRDEELARLLPIRVAVVEIELTDEPVFRSASQPFTARRVTRCRVPRSWTRRAISPHRSWGARNPSC